MPEFLQRLENAVQQRHLLARGQKILVAVSGGVDSMVLLHALHSLAKQYRWKISVAHFNHHLRGRDSNADEKLVRDTAAKLRLKFVSDGAEVKKIAVQSKLSIEMAARKLRHEFLAHAASEHGISTIALAHHADDQVELFFLRLLRGAGGEGLAGMKWRSPSPADKTITLVRPLLDCSKAELLAITRENKIRFRHDATNFSTDALRNRIRNELLPLLRKKYQPGVDKTVLRLMEIIGAEAKFVSAAAENFFGRTRQLAAVTCANEPGCREPQRGSSHPAQGWRPAAPKRGEGGACEPTLGPLSKPFINPEGVAALSSGFIGSRQKKAQAKFSDLPIAVQRKVLQQQLSSLGLMPDFEMIEHLREASGKAVSVGVGLTVVRDVTGKVHCQEQFSSEFNAAMLALKLSGHQGRAKFGGRKFHWRLEPVRQLRLPPKKTENGPPALLEFFDADKIGDEIILRHWQPGDRFQPIGLKSSVKLQDLFVNAKIPSARRRELVLASTSAGEIFWVEGLRIGEQFKLTLQTRRKLVWQSQEA